MRHALLLVPILLFIVPAQSQNTWNNLQFGSSFEDVQQALSKQGLELRPGEGGRWIAEPGWDLRIDKVFVYHFRPELTFDDKKALQRVLLVFDKTWVAGSNDHFLPSLATSSIREELVSKYGAPASETGACKGDMVDFLHASFMDCDVIWKGDGQSISFGWIYESHKLGTGDLSLTVEYAAFQGTVL
jgi:hypothetical protein